VFLTPTGFPFFNSRVGGRSGQFFPRIVKDIAEVLPPLSRPLLPGASGKVQLVKETTVPTRDVVGPHDVDPSSGSVFFPGVRISELFVLHDLPKTRMLSFFPRRLRKSCVGVIDPWCTLRLDYVFSFPLLWRKPFSCVFPSTGM